MAQALPLQDPIPQAAARAPWIRDLRISALVGAAAWSNLSPAVRARFARRPAPGGSVTYEGVVSASRRSPAGAVLAQACRLIGAPLPLSDAPGAPAVVTITEDLGGGGQFWTRIYGRPHGFPQAIHSSKRFAGPTGLEEYLGGGFGIALSVRADSQALHFLSDHYFLKLGALRLRLPAWLGPGALTVSHVDRAGQGFAFILSLRHALLGQLLHQTMLFDERAAPQTQETRHD